MDPVQEIKARLNIADVVGSYVQLKKAGKNFKGLCPFHHEKSPSFIVSPERGMAWCFGCQKGGDVFRFVELVEGIEFPEALKLLAEKAGVQLPERSGATGINKEKRERLLEVNLAAERIFIAALATHPAASAYLAERGLSPVSIASWGVGFAPDEKNFLWPKLVEKGFSKKEIAESGVAGLKEMGGEELYDRFRGRIMFPIRDARGQTVAFTGRIVGVGEPKYLNSPESIIFQKGAVLFGLDRARESIRTHGVAIAVEGQMDVISCHQAGHTNVVASSGTALTELHLALLKKSTNSVIFSFDADRAGVESTRRAILLALPLDFTVRVVRLPAGLKDPDEALKKDPEILRQAFTAPISVFEFLTQVVYAGVSLVDPGEKKRLAREMLEVAQSFASAVDREDFVTATSRWLGVSAVTLMEEIRFLSQTQHRSEPAVGAASPAAVATGPSREEVLLGILLAFPEVARAEQELFAHVAWSLPIAKSVIAALTATGFDAAAALAQLSPDERAAAERLAVYAEDRYAEFAERVIVHEIELLAGSNARLTLEQKRRELLAQIDVAERAGNDKLANELAAEYQKLLS